MQELKIYCLLFVMASSFNFVLRAQDPDLPAPSPWGQVEQKIGLSKVTIAYSRPSAKGRVIFGNIVPYNEIWRTGANQCTQITLDRDVLINDQKVAAGKYALFTIPGETEWTIILNSDAEQWGSYGYKKEKDILRFAVKPVKHAATETLTIGFENVTMRSADVKLAWENTAVSFQLVHDYTTEAQENIKNAISNVEEPYGLYDASAEFYLDNNLDAKQALEWSKKSVMLQERYWNLYNLARAYAANNMFKEAVETAQKSLKLAEEEKNTGMAEGNKKNIEAWKNKM